MPLALLRRPRVRSRREAAVARPHARRVWRTSLIVAAAMLGGLAGSGYAWLCDVMMSWHGRIVAFAGWPTLLLLPLGFGLVSWLTRRQGLREIGAN